MANKRNKKIKEKVILKKIYYFFIILLIALLVFWFLSRPLEEKVLDVHFEVGDRLGVVSGTDELDFGKVLAGSSSIKTVNIENNFDFPIKVDVFTSRNLGDFIFAKSEVVIESGEVFALPINLILPDDAKFGDYNGGVQFRFDKAG